jgi:hypothetical protein
MQPFKGKNALLQDRQLDPLGGTRTYLSTHMRLVKPSDPAERKTVVYDSDEERRKKNSMMHKFGASSGLPRKTTGTHLLTHLLTNLLTHLLTHLLTQLYQLC